MTATADEGMWLLNDPPRERLKEKYDFALTDPCMARASHPSVRSNPYFCLRWSRGGSFKSHIPSSEVAVIAEPPRTRTATARCCNRMAATR